MADGLPPGLVGNTEVTITPSVEDSRTGTMGALSHD
jgi:hypothetical protein